jgi:hypothetical protein
MKIKQISGGIMRLIGKGEFQIGEFSSSTVGKALPLTSTRTALARIYADDGGLALPASVVRAGIARTLITLAQTVAATIVGFMGQIKVTAATAADWLCGLWGYAEVSGASVSTICGVRATVDIPSGATIASGKVAAAFISLIR